MTSLRIASINIEKDNNISRVQAYLSLNQPHVMLLQEVCYRNLAPLAAALGIGPLGIAYVPVSYARTAEGDFDRVGQAILSHLPLEDVRACDLSGRPVDRRDPKRIEGKQIQENLLFATVKDTSGHPFRLATTHLRVTRNGQVTVGQLKSVGRLLKVAQAEASAHGGLLLAGDFNAPRGRAAFDMVAKAFTDNIPPEVTTTIDNTLHSVRHTSQGRIEYVVDGIFSRTYRVTDVHQHAGVSDHLAHLFTLHTS